MDRAATAQAIRRLADEATVREPSLGTLLARLADAVAEGRATEASGYIGRSQTATVTLRRGFSVVKTVYLTATR